MSSSRSFCPGISTASSAHGPQCSCSRSVAHRLGVVALQTAQPCACRVNTDGATTHGRGEPPLWPRQVKGEGAVQCSTGGLGHGGHGGEEFIAKLAIVPRSPQRVLAQAHRA